MVVKGFDQVVGFDYHETSSPIVQPNTIRVVLILVITSRWLFRQLEVKNAFLHEHQSKEVYMT